MKKSTILIFFPVLLILLGLIFYNFKLKELYNTNEYKSRFIGMEFTPLQGIDQIRINAADRLAMEIEQGEKEGIWIQKIIKPRIKTVVDGSSLTVIFSPNPEKEVTENAIIIITKKIKSVEAFPEFEGVIRDNDPTGMISVSGYLTDQFDLKISSNTMVSMNKMQVNTLKATVGKTDEGGGMLTVASNNKIHTAYFNVPGDNIIDLQGPDITKTVYNVSDSARISMSGKLLRSLKK